MTPTRAFLAVLAVYVALGLAYIDVTPYRTSGYLPFQTEGLQKDIGAPDEWQHTNYIRYLVEHRNFPVFNDPKQDFYDHYQSHQPPAYYLLAAPLQAISGGKIQTEKWVLRSFSLLLGCFVLFCIFRGVSAYTDNEWVGALAAAFVGLLPMFLALTTAVSNDVALYLVVCAAMWRMGAALRDGWTFGNSIGLGFIVGIGILTKTSALVVLPVATTAMIAFRGSRANWRHVLAMLLAAAVVSAPWLLRNQHLYGDPVGYRVFQETFKTMPAETLIETNGLWGYWYEAVALRAIWSWWGIFSYFQITIQPIAIYDILTVLFGLTALGLLVRKWQDASAGEKRMHILNLALFGCVLFVFVRFNSVYYQAQARYLYPAIFAVASAFAFGAFSWATRIPSERQSEANRRMWWVALPMLIALIAVNLYALLNILPTGFELLQINPESFNGN